MSGHGKKTGFEALDQQLGGLLGALGSSLSDLVAKLEQGQSGEVNRSQEFQTPGGLVRAETGIRLRMAGMETSTFAKPTNRPKDARAAEPEPTAAKPRMAEVTSYEQAGRFVLSAEVPGVSLSEVSIWTENGVLKLQTTGARRFEATVTLPPNTDPSDMDSTLRHGILVISIALLEEKG